MDELGVASILRRLSQPQPDAVAALRDALAVLTTGDREHRLLRWLVLERDGYGELPDVQPLNTVLGLAASDPLVAAVARYRVHVGLVAQHGGIAGDVATFPHFFVEPVGDLVAVRERARANGLSGYLTLSFGPHSGDAGHPREGEFPADVFDRIVDGFVAELANQLRALG